VLEGVRSLTEFERLVLVDEETSGEYGRSRQRSPADFRREAQHEWRAPRPSNQGLRHPHHLKEYVGDISSDPGPYTCNMSFQNTAS
jgi:hypothetical protein